MFGNIMRINCVPYEEYVKLLLSFKITKYENLAMNKNERFIK